jgi:hypothetical protein
MQPTKILITVMTYPHPSKGYQELVCTAGVTETGDWVRLYPVDHRYRPEKQKFRKYQWIKVELDSGGHGNDNRKASRRPKLETIQVLGEPLSTTNDWAARREIFDRLPHHTVTELKQRFKMDNVSLGIVRPTRVIDLEIREATRDWKPEWQNLYRQLTLFGPAQKPLRKLPYSFHYIFECEDSDKPHTAMCEDWELGVLFLKEASRLRSNEKAAESVKKRFLDTLCAESRDTRFFMGTKFPYNTWLVLGVFWPPKTQQHSLPFP